MNGIEKSIELLSDKYDAILVKLGKESSDTLTLKKRVEVIEPSPTTDGSGVKLHLNESEQYRRRLNIQNVQNVLCKNVLLNE